MGSPATLAVDVLQYPLIHPSIRSRGARYTELKDALRSGARKRDAPTFVITP